MGPLEHTLKVRGLALFTMVPKQKTVFTADPEQVRQIRIVVQRERLAAQVDRYCDEGLGEEDPGLVESQAFGH